MSKSQKVLQEFSDIVVTGKVTQGTVVSATETLASATTLDSTDSGKIFFLNLAGGFTVTLPPVQTGLTLEFIVKTAPTTSYILNAGSTIIHGHALSAADATGSSASTAGTGVATLVLVASKAVVGDYVKLVSDGVRWYASAEIRVFDAVTFT